MAGKHTPSKAFPERLNYGEVASTGAGPEWEFGGGRGPVAAGGGGGVRSALREFDERLRQLSTVEPYSQVIGGRDEANKVALLCLLPGFLSLDVGLN